MTDNTITHLIGTAEKHIAAARYNLALEQLASAQEIEPHNKYIQAIIERVLALQKEASATNGHRYLSVTVDPIFRNGIWDDDAYLSPAEIKTRIKGLTKSADRLLAVGSVESAFDKLMNAYLLDPLNSEVMECEKRVLPAWKISHFEEKNTMSKREAPGPGVHGQSKFPAPTPQQNKSEELLRLELLKLQKDVERREKEKAVWREASKPRPTTDEAQDSGEDAADSEAQPPKIERGLFSKLKLGKFLG